MRVVALVRTTFLFLSLLLPIFYPHYQGTGILAVLALVCGGARRQLLAMQYHSVVMLL